MLIGRNSADEDVKTLKGITTAHQLVLSTAAFCGLAIAIIFSAWYLAAATQSLLAAQILGFVSAIIIASIGSPLRRRVRKAGFARNGFFENAVRRFPFTHLLVGVVLVTVLALYHFVTLDARDYGQVFWRSLYLGLLVIYFFLAINDFKNERPDE